MPEMRAKSRVSAVVLAAGMSRRMGTPKQLLQVGGKTLLENVLGNLRGARVDEIILVLGASAAEIREQIDATGIRVVINDAFEAGMGTSLRAGLAAVDADAEAALIVLADQPFVATATFDRLIAAYQERKPQIALPVYKGFRGNPVLLDRSVFAEVMALTGDVGCRAIFGSHTENILKVPVEDIGVLLDIDTTADLSKLQKAHARGEIGAELLEEADLEGRKVAGGSVAAEAKPQLVVVGLDAFGRALMKLGQVMNFSVTAVDPIAGIGDVPEANRVLRALDFSRLPDAPETCIVIASRGRFDEEAVEQALRTDAGYIALVANKKRAQEIAGALKLKGVSAENLSRLRAPAGVDIGAESQEEIALSVMAEIVAERHRRAAPKQNATGR
jgi:molybdenum cofactor cytidylyltransferase